MAVPRRIAMDMSKNLSANVSRQRPNTVLYSPTMVLPSGGNHGALDAGFDYAPYVKVDLSDRVYLVLQATLDIGNHAT
jgi:hypothetical protein